MKQLAAVAERALAGQVIPETMKLHFKMIVFHSLWSIADCYSNRSLHQQAALEKDEYEVCIVNDDLCICEGVEWV